MSTKMRDIQIIMVDHTSVTMSIEFQLHDHVRVHIVDVLLKTKTEH